MKKGFTLIELLAVIVILAIILVIAVPQILGVIEQTKKDSLSSSAMLVAKTVGQNVMSDDTRPTTINCLDSKYGINSADYESCVASITYGDNVKVEVSIIGNGKFEGLVVLSATNNTSSTYTLNSNTLLLKDVLLSTVGTKDIDVNKYNGNGLYKWGTKYIYRGGITKTNPAGLTTSGYTNDVDSGTEVSNYIKVPWESYAGGETCSGTSNKCWRIMNINSDGSITIIRDRSIGTQRFDNTINTAARVANSNNTNTFGYNDLVSNTPTTGHPEEYRQYSEMYTSLYGATGYQSITLNNYTSILQPIDICLNKVNIYASLNATDYTTTTKVTDTCNVTGKPSTAIVNSLKNKYVRLPYIEEYLNTSLESTCNQTSQYQCRNQNFIYNKQSYWSSNGYSSDSWDVWLTATEGVTTNYWAMVSIYSLRPVTTLKSSVLITGGSGTQALPYIIKW